MGASSYRVSSFREGVTAVFPLACGVFPFGMIVGATAVQAGLTSFEAVASSVLIVGGSAQILAISMLKENAATAIIIFAAIMINLRHIIYSASLSDLSKEHPKRTLGVLSYFLTDECYVTLNSKLQKKEKIAPGYFFGAGLTLWILWQVSTYTGTVLGARLPEWLHIHYFSDFIFLAIVTQATRSKKVLVGVLTACLLSSLLIFLPYKLNILVAAIVASFIATRLRS